MTRVLYFLSTLSLELQPAKKSKDDKDGDRNLLIVAKETGKKKNEDGSEKIDLVDVNFPDDGKNFYIKMYDKGRFKDSTSIKDIKVEFKPFVSLPLR